MTSMGQVQPGIVQVVKPGTDREIGLAFTVEDGNGGQLQRWVLYEDPQNELEIRPAPGMTIETLEQWQTKVREEWKVGWTYVWAQADVYVHGCTYNNVTWSQIPLASALPNESYPPINADSMQLEYKCGGALTVQQSACDGLVFTVGHLLDDASPFCTSVEYWMLPAPYQAAGDSSSTAVTSGTSSLVGQCAVAVAPDTAGELQQFIDLANQSWTDGSRFVITGCINYHGERAPAAP